MQFHQLQAILEGHQRGLIIFAAFTYVIGMLGVTMIGNVPMNEKLAALPADAMESVEYWHTYLKIWTRWNHVRTIASFSAGGLLLTVPLIG